MATVRSPYSVDRPPPDAALERRGTRPAGSGDRAAPRARGALAPPRRAALCVRRLRRAHLRQAAQPQGRAAGSRHHARRRGGAVPLRSRRLRLALLLLHGIVRLAAHRSPRARRGQAGGPHAARRQRARARGGRAGDAPAPRAPLADRGRHRDAGRDARHARQPAERGRAGLHPLPRGRPGELVRVPGDPHPDEDMRESLAARRHPTVFLDRIETLPERLEEAFRLYGEGRGPVVLLASEAVLCARDKLPRAPAYPPPADRARDEGDPRARAPVASVAPGSPQEEAIEEALAILCRERTGVLWQASRLDPEEQRLVWSIAERAGIALVDTLGHPGPTHVRWAADPELPRDAGPLWVQPARPRLPARGGQARPSARTLHLLSEEQGGPAGHQLHPIPARRPADGPAHPTRRPRGPRRRPRAGDGGEGLSPPGRRPARGRPRGAPLPHGRATGRERLVPARPRPPRAGSPACR